MRTFIVSVEKRMYATGAVAVRGYDADRAVEAVQARIGSGSLQTTAVEWDEPQYEDCSFTVTGDVDEADENVATVVDFDEEA